MGGRWIWGAEGGQRWLVWVVLRGDHHVPEPRNAVTAD